MPRASKRRLLREFIAAQGWPKVGEAEWAAIQQALPEVDLADLKHLEMPVEPPWHGVRQQTFGELAESLTAIAGVYEERADLRPLCRRLVIEAKDHARLAARNTRVSEERRRAKSQMAEWMLVWLSDPALFPAWARLALQNLPLDQGTGAFKKESVVLEEHEL